MKPVSQYSKTYSPNAPYICFLVSYKLTPLAALTAIDMYPKPTRTPHDAQPFPSSM